jgi:bifunctional non-homologous end joining protein LigD
VASEQAPSAFDIGGRQLTIRNLDRVVFPSTGTTKGELLDYYARIADVMLAHLRDRLLHMHRYPEGVNGPRFWQKACPPGHPSWIPTAPVWSSEKRAYIEFCVINEVAALVWAVNIGSIELHTSLHPRYALHSPTAMALDLDPGDGAGILECCEVALRLREVFESAGLRIFAKTSGSKGLQLYVPLGHGSTYASVKPTARQIAELLEGQTPERVVSRMGRSLRDGKVLIDWSQNTEHKSMVCVYSVRAKQRPTVSTPVSWREIEEALDAGEEQQLRFEMGAVLERVAEVGDLFEGALSTPQPPRAG